MSNESVVDAKFPTLILFSAALVMVMILFSAALVMVILSAAVLPLSRMLGVTSKLTMGDVYSGWNAAVAAAAFVGLIITIRQQHREIGQTQAELRGQKKQMAKQARSIVIQQFEGTFFNLLRLHHEIVGAMSYVGDDRVVRTGREVFTEAADWCMGELDRKREKFDTEKAIQPGLFTSNWMHES